MVCVARQQDKGICVKHGKGPLTYRISARCLAPIGFGYESCGATSTFMFSSAEMEVFLIPTRMVSMFCWSLSSVRRSSIACCRAVIRSTKVEVDAVLDNEKWGWHDEGGLVIGVYASEIEEGEHLFDRLTVKQGFGRWCRVDR